VTGGLAFDYSRIEVVDFGRRSTAIPRIRRAPATPHADGIHSVGSEPERPQQPCGEHRPLDLAVARAIPDLDDVAAG